MNKRKNYAELLCEIMEKHNMSEICLFDTDILDELKRITGSTNKSRSHFFRRLMESCSGQRLFDDVGIFKFPYKSYRGTRVYRLKN